MSENRSVVMIHGAGDTAAIWDGVGARVSAAGVRWAAPDLPGRAGNETPHPKTIDGLADWVETYLKDNDFGDAVLVGHSMGSLIALSIGQRRLTGVARIVLAATGFPLRVSDQLLAAAWESSARAADIVAAWGHSRSFSRDHPDVVKAHREVSADLPAGTFALDLEACNTYGSGLEAARAIDVPVAVLLASDDHMVPIDRADGIIDALPDSEVVVIPSVGHALADEAPDDVARLVLELAAR